MSLAALYPAPAARHPITHPVTGEHVRLMSIRKLVQIAARMLAGIKGSGKREVVVLESGAAPLARVCLWLAGKSGISIRWHFLKVGRGNSDTYYLDTLPASTDSVLLFDEYVDTGATARNALERLASLGCRSPGIACLCWLAESPELAGRLTYALYRGRENRYWQQEGAYPYENRLDIIGYFYFASDLASGRHYISDYAGNISLTGATQGSRFLTRLARCSQTLQMLRLVRASATLAPVRNFLTLAHCLRFLLAQLARAADHGGACMELLQQLSEMYGPMWSPYPDAYQQDFQAAFQATEPLLNQRELRPLHREFRDVREPLLQMVAAVCEVRRNDWTRNVLRVIEEEA